MNLENFVNKQLLDHGVDNISQLNINDLSNAFNIDVYYWDCATTFMDGVIVVDIKKEPVLQYEEFLHELAHVVYMEDYNTITNLNYWRYLECKTNALVPYLAIPKFALPDIKNLSVQEISKKLNISYSLAYKRIRLYKNKLIGGLNNGINYKIRRRYRS